MKRLALVIGFILLGFTATTAARADYAVVKFNSGFCRVWTDTAGGPQYGRYLWFRHHGVWFYRFRTWDGASRALQSAVAQRRCNHW